MSMMEPFIARPAHDESIAAADAGPGAPEPAPGFGVGGEDPDTAAGADPAQGAAEGADASAQDVPFRTPDPGEVHRPG